LRVEGLGVMFEGPRSNVWFTGGDRERQWEIGGDHRRVPGQGGLRDWEPNLEKSTLVDDRVWVGAHYVKGSRFGFLGSGVKDRILFSRHSSFGFFGFRGSVCTLMKRRVPS